MFYSSTARLCELRGGRGNLHAIDQGGGRTGIGAVQAANQEGIGDRPIFSAQHFSASPPCRAIPAPQHRLDPGQKTFIAQDNFFVREYGISKWWAVPDTRLSCSTLPARKAVSSAWVR